MWKYTKAVFWKVTAKGTDVMTIFFNCGHYILYRLLRMKSGLIKSYPGVVRTRIHADGGGAKMPYSSNFCFKHPMKLKLDIDYQHFNWSRVTDFCCDLWLFFLLTSAEFCTLPSLWLSCALWEKFNFCFWRSFC